VRIAVVLVYGWLRSPMGGCISRVLLTCVGIVLLLGVMGLISMGRLEFFSRIASGMLLVPAAAGWWTVWLHYRAYRREPAGIPLRTELLLYTNSALGATVLAFIGVNYLANYALVPRGSGTTLLLIGVLLLLSRAIVFLLDHYLRG
jgi:hypothetical protein